MIQAIINSFSVNSIFFSVLGYDMSYIEFFGTILNLWSVYLVAKNKILSWPIGIVASVLFMFLFWQIQLYSDFGQQIYYIVTGFWGWFAWMGGGIVKQNEDLKITFLTNLQKIIYLFFALLLSALLGFFMSHVHEIFPTIFTQKASFPYVDAFLTILSFIANYFLIIRKIESWYIWIFVDVISVWMYYLKDVKFVSLLYFLFLILATNGLLTWQKIQKNYETKNI